MLSDPKRLSAGYVPEQFYLRSADEMKARFAEVPEAVTNTLEVAEKCNLEIKFGELHYPVFNPPEHFTREGYLAAATRGRFVPPLHDSRESGGKRICRFGH